MLKSITTQRLESEVIEAVVDIRIHRIVERCLKEHERLHTTIQVDKAYQCENMDLN
jgi:hypothetical protein